MPKQNSDSRIPDWNLLYDAAAPQAGYFTLAQGKAAGYSPELLQYYVRVGKLERAGRALFRLVHFPPSEHEDLVIDWLWSAREGVFSHETALMLEGLSDALPANRHLTLPITWKRRRLRIPPGLVLHFSEVLPEEITWIGPLPLTTPLRTIIDCLQAHVEPALVRQAMTQSIKRGLFSPADLQSVLEAHPALGRDLLCP